jgi:hypothetical protein
VAVAGLEVRPEFGPLDGDGGDIRAEVLAQGFEGAAIADDSGLGEVQGQELVDRRPGRVSSGS